MDDGHIANWYLLGVRDLFVDRHEHTVGHDNQHHEQTEERDEKHVKDYTSEPADSSCIYINHLA